VLVVGELALLGIAGGVDAAVVLFDVVGGVGRSRELLAALVGGLLLLRLRSLLTDLLLLLHHFLVEVLILVVVIVFCKLSNYFLLIEQQHVLLNDIAVLVFPVTVGVVCIEVVSIWWHKRSCYLLLQEVLPRESLHPHMILDVFWPIQT
jgi:hypothetical protein